VRKKNQVSCCTEKKVINKLLQSFNKYKLVLHPQPHSFTPLNAKILYLWLENNNRQEMKKKKIILLISYTQNKI